MPIFDYRCSRCDTRFEELVRSGEDPVRCPECGAAETERLLSAFAVSSGASAERGSPAPGIGPCGSCGDPRGPGSCAL